MARDQSSPEPDFDVDYVISYRYLDIDKTEATAQFEKLIQSLAEVGLQTEVRNGENHTLLVFIKALDGRVMANVVYRSRLTDWLNGIRQAQPDRDTQALLTSEPLTTAERLRLTHELITGPKTEGGADITPRQGEWKNVQSIFALHDPKENKEWIKDWSGKTFLTPKDLDVLRDRLGEKVAYYFAFLQSYFAFLLFPAAFGLCSWALLGHYSAVYGIVNSLWCVVFVEWWKRQERDLALRWGVRNVSQYSSKRKEFSHEKEVNDPITGQTLRMFPAKKRLLRQVLQIPFTILAVGALGALIAACFGIEIFISEVYDGPLKSVLVFIPTGLLTVFVPTISTILTNVATKLNDYENYETRESYEMAMTQKIFVLNFITSYLPIFLTAFVYVPFAGHIVPYLDIFSLTVKPFATHEKQMAPPKEFEINPARLRKQVIYFTVTAQVVNFAMETIVPLLKQKGTTKFKQMQSERAAKHGGAAPSASSTDPAEEKTFLTRVRAQAELDPYDVTADLREMCVQFGYLSLFSVVWPLVPVSFLINNWIELRSDAFKIALEHQRPTPARADSIGPWLDTLGFLSWLGSITSAALVYMFSNDGLGPDGTPSAIKGWALLLTIFFSEHIYLVVRVAVALIISKIDSPDMQKDRAEKYMVRKRYLEETLGSDSTNFNLKDNLSKESAENITRTSLEDDARETSLKESTPSIRFWSRQRGWKESFLVGKGLIEAGSSETGSKGEGRETKKEL